MSGLTPSERRGALMLLALCALGAAWDLLHARPAPAPAANTMVLAAPASPAAPVPPAAPGGTAPPAGALDLNRASAAELDALPGIGPVLAARIVEQRALAGPFRSADELLAVRGIGAPRRTPAAAGAYGRPIAGRGRGQRAVRNALSAVSVQFSVQSCRAAFR